MGKVAHIYNPRAQKAVVGSPSSSTCSSQRVSRQPGLHGDTLKRSWYTDGGGGRKREDGRRGRRRGGRGKGEEEGHHW